MEKKQKYSILFSLYLAQSIPMSFFSTVLPVIMRMEDFSLTNIGLLQLIKIPWIVKFLWAPLVDWKASNNMHYRRWILGSEIFYAVVILTIGLFQIETNFTTIVVLMIIAFILSATQDIASDALAIRILKKKERGFGNSLQSSGNFLGTLFGSGVLLMLYSVIGWQYLMIVLAGIVLVALIPISLYRQKTNSANHQLTSKNKQLSIYDFKGFFLRKNIWRRVILLMLFYSGIVGILAMLKPYLVDLGYSIREIAFMTGIFGTAFGAASTFLGGFIIRKLGNKKAMKLFSFYAFIAALVVGIVAAGEGSEFLIYISIAMIWSAYGMCSVAIYTISMNTVREGREGSDYTIQIVITHLSSLLIVILSGKIGDLIGYSGLFFVEAGLALTVVFLIRYLYHDPELSLEDNYQQIKQRA